LAVHHACPAHRDSALLAYSIVANRYYDSKLSDDHQRRRRAV